MKKTLVAVPILQLALLLPSPLDAAEPAAKVASPVATRLDGSTLYNQTVPGLAWVLTNHGNGTAWVLDRDRQLLVTAAHVVTTDDGNPAEVVKLVFPAIEDGEVVAERSWYVGRARRLAVDAAILALDRKRDLALLRVTSLPAEARALPLASRGVRPGQPVAAVGNPAASEALWVYNEGVVRQVYKTNVKAGNQQIEARVVETQNPVNGGDSGGPLLNAAGEVIGVNSGKHAEGALVSFHIDASEVRAFLANNRSRVAPETAEEHLSRGNLQRDQELYELAALDYDTVIRLSPQHAEAYRQRAGVRVRQGRLDRALADADALLKLEPKDGAAHALRASVLLQQGKHADAIAAAGTAIELAPDHTEAYLVRGRALAGVGDREKALADFTRAVELASDSAEAYERRGDCLVEMGEHARALDDYRQAVEVAGPNAALHARLLKKIGETAKKLS